MSIEKNIKKINICKIDVNKLNKPKNNPNESKTLEKILNQFKTTKVGFIKIRNKDFLVKKEYFSKKILLLNFIYKILKMNIDEYTFYKKYEKKIKEYKLIEHIQLPIKYQICKDFKIYLFSKIDYNLNSFFLKKLNHNDFINVFKQMIAITYFFNHKLKVFHNDLHQNDKIRNFIINLENKKTDNKDINNKDTNNKKIDKLHYDNINIPINKYKVVIIDFGIYSKKMGFKNNLFYNTKSIKYFYDFEIQSELLILFYIILINYYQKKEINFKKVYLYFYNKIKNKTLKDFDKQILNDILKNNNLCKEIINLH